MTPQVRLTLSFAWKQNAYLTNTVLLPGRRPIGRAARTSGPVIARTALIGLALGRDHLANDLDLLVPDFAPPPFCNDFASMELSRTTYKKGRSP